MSINTLHNGDNDDDDDDDDDDEEEEEEEDDNNNNNNNNNTYFHNQKNTSHLHRIICDTYVNNTPLNLRNPLPQQNENI